VFASLSAGIYTLYVIVGLLVGIATLVGYIKRPWTEKAKAHRRQKRIIKLFMNGDPGIPGLMAAITAGPERVAEAEKSIKEHNELLKEHTGLLKTQGETLKKVQNGLTKLTTIVVQLDKKMTSNGGNTNNPGDVQMRMAKSSGQWLSDEDVESRTSENAHEVNNG
jgi:hypothetical protein